MRGGRERLSQMKFDFKDKDRARKLTALIEDLAPEKRLRFVHVCGTHEATITEAGLRSLLPARVQILEGPGCPVCVTPTSDLDGALELARKGLTVATFGDMTRVPGTEQSLEEVRSEGADVRTVYGAGEAVELARSIEGEEVFFGVGFETTAPMTAAVLDSSPPDNFSVLAANKLIPPAMEALLELPGEGIDGFIAPGHVSTIIGVRPYEDISRSHDVPVVIGGFEPLDVLYAVGLLLRQLDEGRAEVENGYERGVDYEGNSRSQEMLEKVFRVEDANWRGIGTIEDSGLGLREKYARWDARTKFDLEFETQSEILPGCLCPSILTARATPDQCELFGESCTPRDPYGPCMVGEEAMCNIWFRYGGRPKL